MKRVPWSVFVAAASLGGCVLAWQPTDTPGAKAGKLAARIPLGAVTLGMSEVVIARETAREAEWQAEAARARRRDELLKEAAHWQDVAITATKDSDRQLALVFYRAARDDLAALDGAAPPAREGAAQAELPGSKKQN
jgi:hypothetical protein